MRNNHTTKSIPLLLVTGILGLLIAILANQTSTQAQETPQRRVNAPNFADGPVLADQSAVFWLGDVDATSNYADVRLGYNNTRLSAVIHVFDKWLWADRSPEPADMENWDAVSLYLQPEGNSGATPTNNAYRFILQLDESSGWEAQSQFQAAYRWQNASWQAVSTSFETKSSWRGDYTNTAAADGGWFGRFYIPFSAFGLSGPPADGTVWGMAIAVHDRDDEAGTAIPDQTWPETLTPNQPSTWGQLHFGYPNFTPSVTEAQGTVTIRQGLNGAAVPDGHVGGSTVCGADYDPDYFADWGSANYSGDSVLNIQNQWDVADWPCFSKYYVTFPLDSLPEGKEIISATLTLHHFGGANPGKAVPSLIQVMTVGEDWNEDTLTWNNSPLARENVAATWVDVIGFAGWPGIPYHWDVSRVVAEAYEAGHPVRLAMYSADGEYHSGKYFSTSDTGDWNAEARPTLTVVWGNAGYSLDIPQPVQHTDAGGTAVFNVSITHDPNSNAPVSLSANSPTTEIQATLGTDTITAPGGQTTLTVQDQRPNPPDTGVIYPITIQADNGEMVIEKTVYLVINGRRVFLPSVLRP